MNPFTSLVAQGNQVRHYLCSYGVERMSILNPIAAVPNVAIRVLQTIVTGRIKPSRFG